MGAVARSPHKFTPSEGPGRPIAEIGPRQHSGASRHHRDTVRAIKEFLLLGSKQTWPNHQGVFAF